MGSKNVSFALIVLGLVVLQGAKAQPAQPGSNNSAAVISALESNGCKQLAGLFGAIRLNDEDIPNNLNVTVLAPTDQAIQNFADSMGLSYAELRARPALVDTLLSYHVIPAHKLTGKGLVAGGAMHTVKPISARSNPSDVLRLQRLANGSVTVTDVQNNTAQVAEPIMLPRANVFPVDRVLLNGDVFDNVTMLLQFHPEFTTLASLVSQTPGLAGTFRANTFNYTLLAPTNDALAAASAALPADEQGRARILQYHTLTRAGTVPDDFKPGAPLMTLLPGHDVTLRYMRMTMPAKYNSSRNVSFTTTTVMPEAGSPGAAANITSTNIFAGRGTVQGIDRVLLPAPGVLNASEMAGTNSTPAAATGHRRLLSASPVPRRVTRHLLEGVPAASRIVGARQLLRFGSRRANGYGGNNGDNGCDPGVDDGCGQPGYASSMMYQDLQDTSDELNSGGYSNAGDYS